MEWVSYENLAYKIIPIIIAASMFKNKSFYTLSNPKVQKSESTLIKIFNSYAGIDFFLRVIQYTMIFLAGVHQKNAKFLVDHQRLVILSKERQLDTIANICGIIRKLTRIPRTILLSGNIKNLYNQSLKQTYFFNKLQSLFLILGDLTNVIYFILDHIMCLFLLGVLINTDMLVALDFSGNYIWTCSSLSYLFRDLVMWRRYITDKQSSQEQLRKMLIFLIVDSLRNIVDMFANIAFLYPGLFQKDLIGLSGILGGTLWLVDFYKY